MTDQSGANSPSGVEPIAVEGGEAFDQNIDAFLNHSFGGDDFEEQDGGDDTLAAAEGNDTLDGGDQDPAPIQAPASGAPAPVEGAPVEGTPAPVEGAPAPLDPALLAAMMLGGEPETPPAAVPASTPAPAAAPAADDAPFQPFDNKWSLPPQLAQALFEADDVETRQKALVTVLSAFGNTIVAQMEQRAQDYHGPNLMSQFQEQQSAQQRAAAVYNDFYGEYPELVEHRLVVQRAGQVLAKQLGGDYTPESRDKVAQLAIQTLTQMGVIKTPIVGMSKRNAQGPAPSKEAPKVVPPRKGPGKTFEAGGARPGGSLGSDKGGNSPSDMLDTFTEHGF